MELTINNKSVTIKGEGDVTVLEAARQAGIRIPHLCALKGVSSPLASCRVCVVEVDGMADLQTGCTLPARDGMRVSTHSPRVQKVRRNIVELLLANHPQDCLICSRSASCELSALAAELGIRERKYAGIRKNLPLDVSSPALVRDPNKCVLCGRCVAVCHKVQGVGAIDFAGRGFQTRIVPGFHEGLNVSDCVYCGQCVRACPTGALADKSHVDAVISALADRRKFVVVQMAPAIPATLAKELGAHSVNEAIGLLSTALRRTGCEAVFDTSFAADLTVVEEAAELVERIRSRGVLPMFTSCSPGWVRFVELHRPELIPHLSTCKSPQQMAGALIKELYPKSRGLAGRELFCVSVMPCTAKKLEATEVGDVDAVLTTRELAELFMRCGIDLRALDTETPLDAPFAEASGAGRIFGRSGGVMEATVRTAHRQLTGRDIEGGLHFDVSPLAEQLKFFSHKCGDLRLNLAVVNGLGELRHSLGDLLNSNLHFVEVMTCPGGCICGGGQPHGIQPEDTRRSMRMIADADRAAPLRSAHHNPSVRKLYDDLLGHPLSKVSHRLLHRQYGSQQRSPESFEVKS